MEPRSPTGRPLQTRAVETKRALLLSAATVFDRHGYSAATMQDVVIEAGRTQGALYKHFRSKADVAEAIMRERLMQREALVEESRTWGLDALHTLARLAVRIARSYQEDVIARAAVSIRDEYYHALDGQLPHSYTTWLEQVTRLLGKGQEDGSIARDLDCAAAARVVVASFYGVQDMSAQLTGRDDLLDRVDEWWSALIPLLTVDGAWTQARTHSDSATSTDR